MTSVGALVAVLSLFIDTTFIPSRTVFEMASVTFIAGILGWLFEIFLGEYASALNAKWREVVVRREPGQSPYDLMNANQLRMTIGATFARLIVFIGWVYVEWRLFTTA